MIDNGYRRIIHFAGPDYLNVYRNRKEGYLAAMKSCNLPVEEKMIIHNNLTLEAGRRSMEMLLNKGLVPDALFSASDYAALGALLFMQEKGFDIPGQFGVAGFSNEKFTSYINPSLTTVHQRSRKMGRYCTELFLKERIGEKPPPSKIMLSPELLIRKSTQRNSKL